MTEDVRMRGFRQRADVEDVIHLLNDRVAPLPAERVSLSDAINRVLAEDVVSEVNVPPFARAAMDGYALRGEQTFGAGDYNPLELEVIGESLPGKGFDGTVASGQAVRIMTGAPIPEGADAVLMAENAEEINDRAHRVRMTESVPPGRHVGHIGEDVKAGSIVLRAERLQRPQDLGVLASVGVSELQVRRRPRVVILITGNELLPLGSKPQGYKIVDSNSIMLSALIERDGGVFDVPPLIKDDYDTIRTSVVDAIKREADAIMISGGSSVGQEDHAPRVIAELGELPVHGIALRPASPAGIGFVQGRPVFLMPGNPVSCLCAYDLFAGPTVRRLAGRSSSVTLPSEDGPYRIRTLPLARKIVSMVGRVDYVRVRIDKDHVEPMATSGASILSSTTRADGFVLVARDSEGHAPGDTTRVFLY